MPSHFLVICSGAGGAVADRSLLPLLLLLRCPAADCDLLLKLPLLLLAELSYNLRRNSASYSKGQTCGKSHRPTHISFCNTVWRKINNLLRANATRNLMPEVKIDFRAMDFLCSRTDGC